MKISRHFQNVRLNLANEFRNIVMFFSRPVFGQEAYIVKQVKDNMRIVFTGLSIPIKTALGISLVNESDISEAFITLDKRPLLGPGLKI